MGIPNDLSNKVPPWEWKEKVKAQFKALESDEAKRGAWSESSRANVKEQRSETEFEKSS